MFKQLNGAIGAEFVERNIGLHDAQSHVLDFAGKILQSRQAEYRQRSQRGGGRRRKQGGWVWRPRAARERRRSAPRPRSGHKVRKSTPPERKSRLPPRTMPKSFQGNPVRTWPRSHSARLRAAASAKMRRPSARPHQTCESEAKCGEKGKAGRQAQHAERQSPGEFVGFGEKSRAEPPQAGDKIAEAHPPSRVARATQARRKRARRRSRRSARPPEPSEPAKAGKKPTGASARAPTGAARRGRSDGAASHRRE